MKERPTIIFEQASGEEKVFSIDGFTDLDSSVSEFDSARLPTVRIYNENVWQTLTGYSFDEVAQHLSEASTPYAAGWEGWDKAKLGFWDFYEDQEVRRLTLMLEPDYELWKKPYSLTEYACALKSYINGLEMPGVEYVQDDELICNGFGALFTIEDGTKRISDELARCSKFFEQARVHVDKMLAFNSRLEGLSALFNFDPSIKVCCNQYLLYFAQFLEDLGMNANVELTERANEVLFTVIPSDGEKALGRIKEALDAYLALATIPQFGISPGDQSNVAVQQLRANICHLQGQLMLAQSTCHLQQATIANLQYSMFGYKEVTAARLVAGKDCEPLIGNAVQVTKLEAKGISIDLPLILRKLKRILR